MWRLLDVELETRRTWKRRKNNRGLLKRKRWGYLVVLLGLLTAGLLWYWLAV